MEIDKSSFKSSDDIFERINGRKCNKRLEVKVTDR